jgi:hypothetical protein
VAKHKLCSTQTRQSNEMTNGHPASAAASAPGAGNSRCPFLEPKAHATKHAIMGMLLLLPQHAAQAVS